MIYYDTSEWTSQIFCFRGTIWRDVWWKVLLVMLYTLAAYCWCVRAGTDLGEMKPNILGKTISFLLVFRANAAYKRYWEGRTVLTTFFCDLREIIALAGAVLAGGRREKALLWRRRFRAAGGGPPPAPDHHDRILCEERTDLLRWCIVLAISLQMHTRMADKGLTQGFISRETKWLVDWDRYRIRHLTTAEEFRSIDHYVRRLMVPQTLWDSPAIDSDLSTAKDHWDGSPPAEGPDEFEINTVPAMRLPMVILYKVNEVIVRNINEPAFQNRPYGMPERFALDFHGLSTKLMRSYTLVTQAVCTPLPFPYFHLCKTLLSAYFLVFPFFIQHKRGLWANVGEPGFLSLALLGVDAIATELENPFGDDDNDLDIYEKISNLEHEIMFFMELSGDDYCRKNFVWCDMPAELTKHCVSPVPSFLALHAQVESNGASNDTVAGGAPRRGVSKNARHMTTEISNFGSDYSDDS